MEINSIDSELIKKDIHNIIEIINKLEITLDKLQDISFNLSKMSALLEQRIVLQEDNLKEIHTVLEMRRVEHNNEIKDIHLRITAVNKELTEKIEESENKILSELKTLRNELITEKKGIGKRIFSLESWHYMLIGGSIVISFFLAKINLNKFFQLFF